MKSKILMERNGFVLFAYSELTRPSLFRVYTSKDMYFLFSSLVEAKLCFDILVSESERG